MKHYCFVVVIILCELVLSCHCLSCEVGYKAKASIGQPVNKMAIQECPDDGKDYECIQLNATFTFLFFSGKSLLDLITQGMAQVQTQIQLQRIG